MLGTRHGLLGPDFSDSGDPIYISGDTIRVPKNTLKNPDFILYI